MKQAVVQSLETSLYHNTSMTLNKSTRGKISYLFNFITLN